MQDREALAKATEDIILQQQLFNYTAISTEIKEKYPLRKTIQQEKIIKALKMNIKTMSDDLVEPYMRILQLCPMKGTIMKRLNYVKF